MKKYALHIILLASILMYSVVSESCANTSTPPMGGDKDTIPPVLLNITPPENSIHFPTNLKKGKVKNISFTFDEYVVIKDGNANIFLSPPQEKKPIYKISGKSVKITFEEPLDSNQTYTLDLGAAINDNNEGNPFDRKVYTFSTGDYIDSIYTAGSVVDAITLLPLDKMTLLFHEDLSDSAAFKKLPDAATKTDVWGHFTMRNIKPVKYSVYAIEDLNNNNKYDPETEKIAFMDSLLLSNKVMKPDDPYLELISVLDTAKCMSRPVYLDLRLFKEESKKQFIMANERPHRRFMYVTFAAANVQIDSMGIREYPDEKLIKQFNITNDSLCIWINDQNEVPDTLYLDIKYHKTDDSLGILIPTTDTLEMIVPKAKKTIDKRTKKAVDIVDTAVVFKFNATPETVEQDGMELIFDYPLIKAPLDSIRFSYINHREDTIQSKLIIEQDSTNIRRYILRASEDLVKGYRYQVEFSKDVFFDINGLPADSLEQEFSLPSDEKLSTLIADMTNVTGNYIVELISENRTKTLRRYEITGDAKLSFPYLKADNYSLRITQDLNKNGLFDTGVLLERKQPEKVLLYKINDGNTADAYLIEIGESMELEQTIDLGKMFNTIPVVTVNEKDTTNIIL